MQLTGPTPERAADFVDGLGVNIHLSQDAITAVKVIADTTYLGLTRIRDHGPGRGAGKSELEAFGALADAGLKLDWLVSGLPAVTVYHLEIFLAANPGAVDAVEGLNEVNNFPITFRGLTGTAAAVEYQRVLYNLVHAPTFPAALPVLDFTDNPVTAGMADAGNAHPYPNNGAQPLATLSTAMQAVQNVLPGKPVYFTEAGYPTLPDPNQPQGVDNLTQAKLTLNLIMDAANLGAVATYLYELVDAPDPTGRTLADHFGLFTADGVAKPSAVAIHDLTTILADAGATAKTFTPTRLNDTLAGLPADGASRVIEKSSGAYDIVVWAEPQIWDPATAKPIAAAPVTVTVGLGARFAQVEVFDPLLSASPIMTAVNTDTVSINLVDHPLIVQVSNFAAAASGLPVSVAAGTAIAPRPGLFPEHVSGDTDPRLYLTNHPPGITSNF